MLKGMLRYQVAYYLPKGQDRMVAGWNAKEASIYVKPANGAKAPVPRHSEIDNRLAAKICRQLTVPPIRS
jgi:hypothetical protein